MSETGTNNATANTELETAVAELLERFGKKDKVVVLANDDMESFLGLVEKIGDANYKDWTKNAPGTYNGLALVRSDNLQNRLIALASEDDVFSDPIVRKALYKTYIARVVSAAQDDEANPAAFITTAGCYKAKFDLDAFDFQWRALAKVFRNQKLTGVNKNSLRMAFASSAFAKSQFPRLADAAWDMALNIASANAEKHNYDTSIFDHWKATRAVALADTSEIEFNFDALNKALEAETGDTDDADTDKPAETAATGS